MAIGKVHGLFHWPARLRRMKATTSETMNTTQKHWAIVFTTIVVIECPNIVLQGGALS